MTPIEIIQALERRRTVLRSDMEILDDIIESLKKTRSETIHSIESVMESEFTHGWRALKRFLTVDG